MSRGGRHFLAALAGLAALFTVFGLGLLLGSSASDSKEKRYQAYRYAADKPLELEAARTGEANPKALEYREPCREPKGSGESDLCAQWRAAYAGEDSASWAQWSFWAAIGGVLGLAATLVFNLQAWRQARESINATKYGQRAWMALQSYQAVPFSTSKTEDGSQRDGWQIHLIWKNCGPTPSISAATAIAAKTGNVDEEPPFFPLEINTAVTRAPVGPGMTCETVQLGLAGPEFDKFLSGESVIFIYAAVFYNDIFDKVTERRTEVCLRFQIDGRIMQEGRITPRIIVNAAGPQNRSI